MTEPVSVLDDLTEDVFLGGRFRAFQPHRGYRAGIDAILLAAAAPIDGASPASILDAGAGVGVVGLAVAVRCPEARVTLLERDPDLVRLAERNIAANALAERLRVVGCDIAAPAGEMTALDLAPDSIDHALANPPYFVVGRGLPAKLAQRAASRAMAEGELERWARTLARLVRPGGTVTIIHRAVALHELLDAMRSRFGGVSVRPIAARDGEAATRILVQGVKGSAAPLRLEAPLVLHGDGHGYRPDIEALVSNAGRLQVGTG